MNGSYRGFRTYCRRCIVVGRLLLWRFRVRVTLVRRGHTMLVSEHVCSGLSKCELTRRGVTCRWLWRDAGPF